MKKLPIFYIAFLLIISVKGYSLPITDMPDDISSYIKSGNSKEIAKYFASTVSITILNQDETVSKIQAESALKDFFAKNSPLSVKPIHKLSSNPNIKFTVILLHTSNGDFRVSFSLKNFGSEFLLTELRIEPNKE